MTVSQKDWAEAAPKKSISIEEMDNLVKDMRKKRLAYDDKKAESTELHHVFSAAEMKLKEALRNAGKTKYTVDGLGMVYTKSKLVVSMPKDLSNKKKFLQYLRAKGEETYLAIVGVNSRTLNSFYSVEFENAKAEENALGFEIPGISEPTTQESLVFKKDTKKGK